MLISTIHITIIGLARSSVCTHNHELESGRTSCISQHTLHFSKEGNVLNADVQLGSKNAFRRLRALSDLELADETHRVVSLIGEFVNCALLGCLNVSLFNPLFSTIFPF